MEGEISDNIADTGCGGGIYNLAEFIMSGGVVQENASFSGVGVYNNGTFEMRGGKILNNHGQDDGNPSRGQSGGGVLVFRCPCLLLFARRLHSHTK